MHRMSAKVEEAPLLTTDDNDFQSLEEKVYRTIELLKGAREAKAAVERDNSRLREQLETREEELETARQDLITLRKEREEVRGRVDKMLKQIEQIAAEETSG
jgi:chromosome segregation ATPase